MTTLPDTTRANQVFFDHGYGSDKLKNVANPAIIYLASLGSTESQKTMRRVLNQVSRASGYKDYLEVPWVLLTRAGVFVILEKLTRLNLSPASRNACLSAIKGVAREARLSSQMDGDTYQSIKLVKQAKFTRTPKGRLLPTSEIQALLDMLLMQQGVSGVRDAALLGLMYGCGPRRSELASIKIQDWDKKNESIRVVGKGNKERILELPNRTLELLHLWIEERGEQDGPLFNRIDRWNNINETGLSHQGVYYVVNKRVAQAGLDKASPHDLRRTFITYLLDAEVDIAVVSNMAGHTNINTTKIYDLSKQARNKKAAQKISF
ncbi:tyrosine-type recombinase/integrase [Dasania marina]|uniref:tyrosine-type recombinase/integrase n=1 Tax=Dasania marina TaxID=471499 RepID=UPI0030DD45C7|tara:strand:+ start:6762 stop:7724 length:963 start_codon:yes stop_codon:yes gene_type:complete